VHKFFEQVGNYNNVIENGVRLAAFQKAREAGMSEERAASLAKNLTVNFNRRGNAGTTMNALYLFANASVQGGAVVFNAAKNPAARKYMYAIVAFAAALDIMNRIIGGRDDDGEWRYDKIDQSIKERNMILMLPEAFQPDGKKSLDDYYYKLPLPYGYNVLHVLGSMVGRYIDRAAIGNVKEIDPLKDALNVTLASANAFNPIGTGATITQTIAPTALSPFVQLGENVNWAGNPIVPPQDPYDQAPKPMSERYFRSASEPAKWIAREMNKLGGGDESRPSKIGILDNSPETLDFLYNYAVGGAGTFVENTVDLALKAVMDPSDIDVRKIPFVRRLVGSTGGREIRDRYYENVGQIEYADKELEAAAHNRDQGRQKSLHSDYAAELGMREQAKSTQAFLKHQRVLRRAAEQSQLLPQAEIDQRVKAIEERMDRRMQDFNKQMNLRKDKALAKRDGIAQVTPFIQGRSRDDAVASLNEAGFPDLAALVDSLPRRPRRAAVVEMQKLG
jgi:hypothetical protein